MESRVDKRKLNKAAPPAAGRGRPKGVPNKATGAAREAIAMLVDDSAPMLREWLAEIAEEHGKLVAWKCVMDVIEYHIPKLQRTELSGKDGGPIQTVTRVEIAALGSDVDGKD